ncbi:MAG: ATP-binding cassette domain-containing protein [Defluviitaleaceae bacterium]|nr:ATP-binding cassette domain-containing protein [Defluviitaleaceae bacterium]
MIKLQNVTKIYKNSIHALQDATLDIDAGDIFGIIGKSGAGKSTMLKMIGLLERPDAGRIEILGQDVTDFSGTAANTVKKQMGTVFQGFNLLMQRNVEKNIAFPLELIKADKTYINQRVSELAGLVDLTDKLKAYPAQLSGGQKQRVAIARALATNPKILLCDEPTSALDSFTTGEILRLLRDINTKLGITIIIITHEIGVIRAITKRMAVLSEGRVVELGQTADIIANPQHSMTKLLLNVEKNLDGEE